MCVTVNISTRCHSRRPPVGKQKMAQPLLFLLLLVWRAASTQRLCPAVTGIEQTPTGRVAFWDCLDSCDTQWRERDAAQDDWVHRGSRYFTHTERGAPDHTLYSVVAAYGVAVCPEAAHFMREFELHAPHAMACYSACERDYFRGAVR